MTTSKRGRKSGQKNLNEAAAMDRACQAFALRRAGLGYAAIAVELGCSAPTAKSCVDQWLGFMAEHLREDHADVLAIEVDRLDGLTETYYPLALAGDGKAAEVVLRVMERRARYLGLDAKIDDANKDGSGLKWSLLLERQRPADD